MYFMTMSWQCYVSFNYKVQSLTKRSKQCWYYSLITIYVLRNGNNYKKQRLLQMNIMTYH